jgi:hypothetical protein
VTWSVRLEDPVHGVGRVGSTNVKLSVDDAATGEGAIGAEGPAALRDNATAPRPTGNAFHTPPMLNVLARTGDGAIGSRRIGS